MKKILLFLTFVFVTNLLLAQDTIKIDSKIIASTVFIKGSQITRTADVDLKKGVNVLVFKDLSNFIDDKSIQVKAQNENLTILSVKHRFDFFSKPDKKTEIEKLEKRRDEISKKVEENNAITLVYAEEKNLILANNSFGGTKTGVNSKELDSASVLFRKRLTEIMEKQLELSKEKVAYYQELSQINMQLQELNNTKVEKTSQIVVSVVANKSVKENFAVSYVVGNSKWTPKYDIRVDDISQNLSLVYKADIQ